MDALTDAPTHAAPDKRPGAWLARGVMRHLSALGFACIDEFVPAPGKRLDVLALGPRGEFWIVECKSSRADFTSDHKWDGYLEWGDRFFWAVDAEFPVELLPDDTGLIIADAWDAAIAREAPECRLAPARRKAQTLRFAHVAAQRSLLARDPGASL